MEAGERRAASTCAAKGHCARPWDQLQRPSAYPVLLCFTLSIVFLHSHVQGALLLWPCCLVPAWLSREAAYCKLYQAGGVVTLPIGQGATAIVCQMIMGVLSSAGGGVSAGLGRGDRCDDDSPAARTAEGAPALKDCAACASAQRRVLAQPLHARLPDLQPGAAGACMPLYHRVHGSVRVPLKFPLQQAPNSRLCT